MRSPKSLPSSIPPPLFFEELLLEFFQDLFSPPPLWADATFSLTSTLTGDGGGQWSLSFDLGDVSLLPSPPSRPFLSLLASRRDWDVVAGPWLPTLFQEIHDRGGPEAWVDFLLEESKRKGHPLIRLHDSLLSKLQALPFLFRAQIDDWSGAPTQILIGVWETHLQRTPDFSLHTDRLTFEALRSRTLDPFEAWKNKRVRVEGQLALALKVANLFAKH